ncbi:unnamed protein product [Allacma fusca]|uniref:Uncharacterized protein n=1 Tax=Allacma fusca TaxID=39272 RepID=A0A8J2KRH0_9HEXA|nr:unnamed protein product [Allacma fusca]
MLQDPTKTFFNMQGIDHVHGCHCLPLGVFSVSDRISDHVLKEHLQNSSGLFVDQARDTLHSSTTSQPTNGGFRNSLDVIPQHFPVTLSSPLSKTFTSLASASHVEDELSEILLLRLY